MPHHSLLVTPSAAHAHSYAIAIREGYEPDPIAPAVAAGMDAHIAWLNTQGDQIRLPDGRTITRLPHAQFWLVHAHTFIGRVNIRFQLTEDLERWGGHIGYAISPSFQRRGFGTHILGLGIKAARAGGLDRLLLTCLDTNFGSMRVIEANGGRLLNKVAHPWQPHLTALRYAIDP